MKDRDKYISELYLTERERLLRVAYRLTGDIHLAQDNVQETFKELLENPHKLDGHPNPSAWLTRTVYYKAMNERRLCEHTRNVSLDQLGDIFPAELGVDLSELMPEDLTDDERRLLTMRYEARMSCREIGDKLGISENASSTRLFRLIQKIRKKISEKE